MMFWTQKERQEFWERNQVRFAEVAHEYICCDVPTLVQCFLCGFAPRRCKNKEEVVRLIEGYKDWGQESIFKE